MSTLPSQTVTKPAREKITNERISEAVDRLAQLPQVDCPLTHRFLPGVYVREILMPAKAGGTFIIGNEHKSKHWNVVLTGRATVYADGVVMQIVAPFAFESEVGVRKVLHIHEDMIFQTIHDNPDNETSIDVLEERLFIKTDTVKALEWARKSGIIETSKGASQP